MRVHYLTRQGMTIQALKFILKENPNFEITLEQYKNVQNTKKYDKKLGFYTSKEIRRIDKAIYEYLDEHYLMYELDYTSEGDYGSRYEVILVCKKITKPIQDGLKEVKFNDKNIHIVNSVDEGLELVKKLAGTKETYVLLENDLPDSYNE